MHRSITVPFAFLAVLTAVAAPPSRAGFLTNTAVTRDQFAAAFDITTPAAAFLETQFKIDPQEVSGVFRSEVFAGKGDNAGTYAYLYQIMSPGQTAISEFVVDDFVKSASAKVNNNNVTSIYVSQGVAAGTPIDMFKVNGTVAPTGVFVSDLGLAGLLVDYSRGKVPAGDTSYIVGVFSKLKPKKVTDLVVNGSKSVVVSYYTTIPEPSSLVMAASAVAFSAVSWHRRRRTPAPTS
jgi:hypothetical protein